MDQSYKRIATSKLSIKCCLFISIISLSFLIGTTTALISPAPGNNQSQQSNTPLQLQDNPYYYLNYDYYDNNETLANLGAVNIHPPLLNCSKYVPAPIFTIAQKFLQVARANSGPKASVTLPQVFLQSCLSNKAEGVADFPVEVLAKYDWNFGVLPINVDVNFGLNKLIDFDDGGSFTFSASYYLSWTDINFPWLTGTVHEGVKFPSFTTIPASKMWIPKFKLINCETNDCDATPDNDTATHLSSNGTAKLLFQRVLTASCNVDMTYFPNDIQTCILSFVIKWEDANIFIKLNQLNNQIISMYFAADEWTVMSILVNNLTLNFENYDPIQNYTFGKYLFNGSLSGFAYPGFQVIIQVQRIPTYFYFNLIYPILVNVVVGLVSAFIPFSGDAKTGFLLATLSSFFFLMTVVSGEMPVSNETPLVAQFVLYAIMVVGLAIVCSVLTSSINEMPKSSPPPLVLRFAIIRPMNGLSVLIKIAYYFLFVDCCRIPDEGETQRLVGKDSVKKYGEEAANVKGKEIENEDELDTEPSNDKYFKRELHVAGHRYTLEETWQKLAKYMNHIYSFLYIAAVIFLFFFYLFPVLSNTSEVQTDWKSQDSDNNTDY